jgi:uncharacterized repeat protein (TIGR01451 family)
MTSPITSTQSGANTNGGANVGYGQADLTVIAPPVISKTFGNTNLITGNTTSLTFTITNPNSHVSLTGVAFTDTLPSGLVVATPNGLSGGCGSGTITATAGTGSISLSGATLTAGSSCTFTVNVTGTTAGTKNNSVQVTSTNGGTGNTATASVYVRDAIHSLAFLKQVGPTADGPWYSYLPVAIGDPVYYRFTIENTGEVNLTNVSVSDGYLAPFTCTWKYIAVTAGPTETLTNYATQSPLTIPAIGSSSPAWVENNHIAYCVPSQTTTETADDENEHTNTATLSTTGLSNVTSSATYKGVNPTAVNMGAVELLTVTISDFLSGMGVNELDAAGLLNLLRAWDPASAEYYSNAGREKLLAAVKDYLDPDSDGLVVVLRWETLEERGTVGFYAERRQDGEWTRINSKMLPGMIASPMGAQYWLVDPGARPDDKYQYRLIEVEARGATREYGPFDLRVRNTVK